MPETASAAPAAAPAAPPSLAQLSIDRNATPPRRRKRWLWPVIGLLAAAGIAAVMLAPRPLPVQASSVLTSYPTQQYAELAASGFVVAQRRAAVSSKGSGRLIELNVREGSVVKRGELIARIDAADVSAAMAASVAGVAQTQAALAQAEADVRRNQAEAANADAELKRQKDLQQQGFVAPQAVEAAERRAAAAKASVEWSRAAVANARAVIAQAQAQVQVQRVNQGNTEIRAPFDGVVLVKNANVGDLITPFSSAAGTLGAVVTMADMSTLEVEADVSESNVARVKLGQPVEITLDALPGSRLRGTVAGIVPTVDRAKATVMTKIRFEKLDPRILPEMSAKVNFLSRAATDADQQALTAVNPKAVVEREGRKLVYRITGTGDALTVQAVPVTPARTLGDALELSNPALKSGERVVLNPPAKLKDGDRVSLIK